MLMWNITWEIFLKTNLLNIRREVFDPQNLEHLRSYYRFITEGRWGDIQFFSTPEHSTVPSNVSDIFTKHYLPIAIVTASAIVNAENLP